MGRREPPPIATWMLDHCVLGGSHEAVAGDIRESYTSGQSDGWYRRQVFAACAVSWSEGLRDRVPIMVFALAWSMMAPAWKMFTDGIEDALSLDRVLTGFGPLWFLIALDVWVVLNSIFVWAGIAVFVFFQGGVRQAFRGGTLRRAFLLAPLVLVPVFGAVRVFGSLYWYTFFADTKIATTPLGQIADLQMLSDVIRLPYLIALVAALWRATPSMRRSQFAAADSAELECATPADALQFGWAADGYTVKRFLGFMVICGLINATLVSILLYRLSAWHSPTISALLCRAIVYVVVGVIAGVAGSWLYWKNPASLFRKQSPVPFPLFALVCTEAWIWIPSMAIFSDHLSAATAIVAVVAAVFLARGFRHANFEVFSPAIAEVPGYEPNGAELFSQSLYRAHGEARGYVITLLIYAGGGALAIRVPLLGAALFALGAFLFVWTRNMPPGDAFDGRTAYTGATVRLACFAIPAVLVTAWALLEGVSHRNRAAVMDAAASAQSSTSGDGQQLSKSKPPVDGLGGYQSLILWPVPEKKQIFPPPPERSVLAPGATRALVIPFSGQYWYVQPPNKVPGPTAHRVHGTPLGGEIASINSEPLVMDAHQMLATAIPTVRCRNIEVEIENRDNRRGRIALGVLLSYGASRKDLYLGQQSIVSTQPEHFSVKSGSVFETLRFSVPASAKMRKFDEITVTMLPEAEHALIGPKIAIKQFQILPR